MNSAIPAVPRPRSSASVPRITKASDTAPGSSAAGERSTPNSPHMPVETPADTGRFERAVRPNKLGPVNRAPRWLLPTVLTALILAVVVGAVLG
ncbi:hypothetical protein GCM10022416_33630 [Actinomadura keratinilytica]|uniref:Uncharacterized protein n=2 Tax=Actinomadura keratinilytica TaxID=547461 RepID=A0ABP7YY97_9ACTN